MAKLIKVKSFMNGDNMLINADMIVKAVSMREQDGSVITMEDKNKIFIMEDLDYILSAANEVCCDGAVRCGAL